MSNDELIVVEGENLAAAWSRILLVLRDRFGRIVPYDVVRIEGAGPAPRAEVARVTIRPSIPEGADD